MGMAPIGYHMLLLPIEVTHGYDSIHLGYGLVWFGYTVNWMGRAQIGYHMLSLPIEVTHGYDSIHLGYGLGIL